MSLYWSVKKFKVSVSGSLDYDNQDSEYPVRTETYSGEFDLTTLYYSPQFGDETTAPTSEDQLVCGYDIGFEGVGGDRSITGVFEPSNDPFPVEFYSAALFYKQGELYKKYGQVRVSGLVLTGVSGGTAVGTCEVKIAEKTITSTLFSLDSLFLSGSINMTLTGTEYWSYGETYNTSTGARL